MSIETKAVAALGISMTTERPWPYYRGTIRLHLDKTIDPVFHSFRRDSSLEYAGKSKRNEEGRKKKIEKLRENKGIQDWLDADEVERLSHGEAFDKYFWTNDAGDTWEDMYPFVRPDVGWWMTRKLSDYTVKLQYEVWESDYVKKKAGTGWFFDFAENNGGYPLKWYIATNAHVLNEFRFGKDPYKQGIPSHCVNLWWYAWECVVNREITLYKDTLMGGTWMQPDKDPQRVWGGIFSETPSLRDHKEDLFLEASDSSVDPLNIWTNQHPIYKNMVRKFNFVYYAKDFMKFKKSDSSENYSIDFAVLEVEFESELTARRMTNNLYDKYYKEGSGGKPLNFFSGEADKEFMDVTGLSVKPFFTAGYPRNSLSAYRVIANYSSVNRRASKAIYKRTETSSTDPVIQWRKKTWRFNEEVYAYLLNNFMGSGGASGSLMVDVDGNVLGIVTWSVSTNGYVLVHPLRNYKGKDRTKLFDLIEGVDGQKSSYKSVIVGNDLKTYLRRIRGWG